MTPASSRWGFSCLWGLLGVAGFGGVVGVVGCGGFWWGCGLAIARYGA